MPPRPRHALRAGEPVIRQVLETGPGPPPHTTPATHRIFRQHRGSRSRVLYADHDPMVVAHLNAFGGGDGVRSVVADLCRPAQTLLPASGRTMDANTWEPVYRLRGWLDENAGGQTERERCLLRVLKIGEEYGEVAEAVHGVMGANPRKGESHTWDDVHKELCDVIVTSMVALATCTPDAAKVLDDRLRHLVDRALPTGEDAR
ncbi:SAM-dependent methyltransferase [Streptomyces sp. NPDC004609]|uniref:MazG-like family protein n=1 Tax=Streptomyces sp. NPDC004609 TaxID=3364704 RepID=UPI00368EB588